MTVDEPITPKEEKQTILNRIFANPYLNYGHKLSDLSKRGLLTQDDIRKIISSINFRFSPDPYDLIRALAKTKEFTSKNAHRLLVKSKNEDDSVSIDIEVARILAEEKVLDNTCIDYIFRNFDFTSEYETGTDFLVAITKTGHLSLPRFKQVLNDIAKSGPLHIDEIARTYIKELLKLGVLTEPFIDEVIGFSFVEVQTLKGLVAEVDLSRSKRIEVFIKLINEDPDFFVDEYTSNSKTDEDFLFSGTPLTKQERKYIAEKTGLILCSKVGSGHGMIAFVDDGGEFEIYAGCTTWSGTINKADDPIEAIRTYIRHPNVPDNWEHGSLQELRDWRKSVRSALTQVEQLAPVLVAAR